MIGTKFYKPLELDKLIRTVTRIIEREVQEHVPVLDDVGNPIDYKTATKTVTEEVPEQEEYDNPAPNTLSRYREAAEWCNTNGAAVIEDKGEYYEVVALPEPTEEECAAALQAQYTALIQSMLDKEAQKLGYDSCLSVCSYIDTGVTKFDVEGKQFRAWRSAIWKRGYELLDEVKAGTRAVPTPEELPNLLPKLTDFDEVSV